MTRPRRIRAAAPGETVRVGVERRGPASPIAAAPDRRDKAPPG